MAPLVARFAADSFYCTWPCTVQVLSLSSLIHTFKPPFYQTHSQYSGTGVVNFTSNLISLPLHVIQGNLTIFLAPTGGLSFAMPDLVSVSGNLIIEVTNSLPAQV